MNAVSLERWDVAQSAERHYWEWLRSNDAEFLRVLAEKVATARWIGDHFTTTLPDGDWAEIGIGPLGIGCIHFLPAGEGRLLVGIEPLPLIAPAELRLSEPLVAAVEACRCQHYIHHTGVGEATGLEADRFGLIACYNVLDHVRDPAAVLAEAYRILRVGGKLVIGCDTVSTLSRWRFALYVKYRYRRTVGVRAHTFRFGASELESLVQAAGLRLLNTSGRAPRWFHETVGHAQRRLILCEKAAQL